MPKLNEALAAQIDDLDLVLLRLTTLRLLMAAGQHRMTTRALQELEEAFVVFDTSQATIAEILTVEGRASLDDAIGAAGSVEGPALQRLAARSHARQRDARVALSSTGAAAALALRSTTVDLSDPSRDLPQAKHGFLTGRR